MYYKKEVSEVLKEFNSSINGITQKDAEERINKYGRNIIQKFRKLSPLKVFINQFKSFIIYVLVAAAILALVLGERLDAVVIFAIVIINAVLGFFQEFKAEKSIEALRKLSNPTTVVIRDGKTQKIESSDVVPGDIVIIEEGCYITADARLIEIASLTVDESTLTGESVPVEKNLDLIKKDILVSNQKNMVFAGTIASRGRGKAVVVATGLNTELGKIAKEIQVVEEKETPLQKKLSSLGIQITIAILIITVVIFVLDYFRGNPFIDSILTSIALAVAAIPEGLPAVVTITLAFGTQRMLKKNALVRRLSAVEALGSITVICADKTGTLTSNQMTVVKMFVNNKLITVTGNGYNINGEFFYQGRKIDAKEFDKLMEIAAFCNNATLEGPCDPTEKAILVAAKKANYNKTSARLKEIPFSSETKFMITQNKLDKNTFFYLKGASEIVLNKCSQILVNNKEIKLTQKNKDEILKINEQMASEALRVLGLAYSYDNKNFIFTGLMAMIDPPREGVNYSIEMCKKAGIKVVMITGDHSITAKAIAQNIGIEGDVVKGEQLDKMTEDELAKSVNKISIYARVSPQHKVKILEALKKQGNIVAMTGDGVNDAIALKKSDIGTAVGSGTDVAKEASDIVLLDDNFISIVDAIKEGRGIYNNIKKFIGYLFSCNLAEVAVIFISLLIGLPLPLIAIQILWMNLLTDGLPALALGLDKVDNDVMDKPPRNPKQKLITKKDLFFLLSQAFVLTAVTIGLFVYYLNKSGIKYGQTIAFTTLVMLQLFNAVNYHNGGNTIFSRKLFNNKYLFLAMSLSIMLQLLVVYVLNNLFKTVSLLALDWIFVIAGGITVLVVQEIIKIFIKPDY